VPHSEGIAYDMLTQEQIDRLQELIRVIEESGFGWVVIAIERGAVRYIVPAPSLDFRPEPDNREA